MAGDFTDGEMRSINRCRMYLQVECLSDVCTADGLTTDTGLQAQSPTVTSLSTIKWPQQGLPGPRSWVVWRPRARGQYGDGSSKRTHVIPRTNGYARFQAREHAPTLNLAAYYDSSSKKLCQMVPQQVTAMLATSSTYWTYHPTGIESTRRFIAVSNNAASIQDLQRPPARRGPRHGPS